VLQIALMVLAVILWVVLLSGGEERVNPMIYLGYVAFFLAIGIAIFAFVNSMLNNPQALKGALLGLAGFAVIFLISYLMASGSDFESYKNATESTVRWVKTGLNAFYFITLITVLVVIYSGVARFLK
jgi:hypothetical protein